MSLTLTLLEDIETLNPWFKNPSAPTPEILKTYVNRSQQSYLLDPEWDSFWTVLVGPRRAGKTTLANYLCKQLLSSKRFKELLYLNCDYDAIRQQFSSPSLIVQLVEHYKLNKPIIFIDEVQRLENPGLLLKGLIDLNLPYKWIATGSSQLEIKSKISEHLTGRAIESLVLPLSISELPFDNNVEERLIYGSYPRIISSKNKVILLEQLYRQYIEKDIIKILKLNKPEIIEKLMTLVAHSSSQLINYQQFAIDCQVSVHTVQSHLQKLEQTYIISKITPFVGNKRTEITNNPKYYFIDSGFRNQAIRNFNPLTLRSDAGNLVENFIYQEIIKFKHQHFYNFNIHFWRTKTKAEVDFILYKNKDYFIPIESKYETFKRSTITRAYRSFLEAYQPQYGIIITKNYLATEKFENTTVHFIPLEKLETLFPLLEKYLVLTKKH